MPFLLKDRVQETTTSTGTGTIALGGAPSGSQTFSSVCSIGDTFWYSIAGGTEWESGLGTYSATNTLTRTIVFESSNSNAAVSFSAGTKDVFIDFLASRAAIIASTNRRNILLNSADNSKSLASYRRGEKVFATGFKGGSDALDGIKTASSSNYSLDSTNGLVKPTSGAAVDQVPGMTGATAPSGTASASTEVVSGEAWRAFDNLTGDTGGLNTWAASATTGWVQYQFGAGTTIGSYTIRAGNFANGPARAPNSWTLKASNTGAFSGEETTLDTQSGQTFTQGQERAFTVSAPGTYTYYRLSISAINGGSFVQIDEVQLLGIVNNLTIVTVGQIPSANPSIARVVFECDVNLTPTTDVTAEVSADNGSNFTAGTLAQVGQTTLGAGTTRYIYESAMINVSANTGVTGIMARLKTLTNKAPNFYRLAFEWE